MRSTVEEDPYHDPEDESEDDMYETMDDAPVLIEAGSSGAGGLFIGSFMSEQNLQGLKQSGITHVLQVADGMTPSHPHQFAYCSLEVADLPSVDLVAQFTTCFDFIDQALNTQGGVLVHCVAGVSRSATVCIGYLMQKHKLAYEDAFTRVHSVRPWVMPNEGFRRQLVEFERLGWDLQLWTPWRAPDGESWVGDGYGLGRFGRHLQQQPNDDSLDGL